MTAPSLKKRARPGEVAIRAFLFFCGFLSIVTTLGILYELGKESLLFFQDESVSVLEFFTHTVWQPQAGVFGVLPLVLGTVLISLIAVPDSLRQAAYGLGASRLEVSLRIVVPAALSGIAAGVVVAMSRAVGETMVVTLASGAAPRNFQWGDSIFGHILNPFTPAQAMTGYIAVTASGDIAYNTIDYNSIFAIGLALFIMTLGLNALSRRFVKRFRQVYE